MFFPFFFSCKRDDCAAEFVPSDRVTFVHSQASADLPAAPGRPADPRERSSHTGCNAPRAPASRMGAKHSSEDHPQRPRWVPDEDRGSCVLCYTEFSFTNRRHHCRSCGEVVCKSCSDKKMKLDHMDYKKAQRVCVGCHVAASNGAE